MDIMAVSIAGLFADWIWPVLGFVAGLGLVIFVHELGHFLVAKAVGIKVERFALGFGPRLLGFVRNETDYCVNLLPLGGYVKMLGQEDFKPLEGEQADPRAFYNKSVGARLAVISAGVVMNVILAAVLFVIVCLVG
ncbi:MAG TPA: site-2 protease family protein, partial [Phycisphaerae bacterium]|nr:site-2 protease family protein [Phycisphaerae bacterium]